MVAFEYADAGSSANRRIRRSGMERIENHTFGGLKLGDTASLARTLT